MGQILFTTTPHDSGLGNPLATAFEFQQSMNTELYETVVFEVPGMGLSEVSFTAEDKAKLDAIVLPLAPQVQSDYGQTNASSVDFIKNKKENLSEFANDGDGISPFITVDEATAIFSGASVPKLYFICDGIANSFDIGVLAEVRMVFLNRQPLSDLDWTQTGSIFTLTFIPDAGDEIKPI
jgi:hypothetical protein